MTVPSFANQPPLDALVCRECYTSSNTFFLPVMALQRRDKQHLKSGKVLLTLTQAMLLHQEHLGSDTRITVGDFVSSQATDLQPEGESTWVPTWCSLLGS